jgi:hypothetical protein
VAENNETTVVARTESRSRWRRAGVWLLVLMDADGKTKYHWRRVDKDK